MKRNHSYWQRYFSPVIALVLCALYILFSVGVVKASHLCMGREASVAYFTFESAQCGCSLFAGEKDDCCEDSHELLKLEDSQKHLTGFGLSSPKLCLLGQLYDDALMRPAKKSTDLFQPTASDAQPPPKALFKLHCSFVFYR